MALHWADKENLERSSFLSDFQKFRSEFIELARIAYHSTEQLKRTSASPDDCEELYSAILLNRPIFRGVLARKRFLSSTFYPVKALEFARYVLHNHWQEIIL